MVAASPPVAPSPQAAFCGLSATGQRSGQRAVKGQRDKAFVAKLQGGRMFWQWLKVAAQLQQVVSLRGFVDLQHQRISSQNIASKIQWPRSNGNPVHLILRLTSVERLHRANFTHTVYIAALGSEPVIVKVDLGKLAAGRPIVDQMSGKAAPQNHHGELLRGSQAAGLNR